MGGNDYFFENFERNKYFKKLPSMQRVNYYIQACKAGQYDLSNQRAPS